MDQAQVRPLLAADRAGPEVWKLEAFSFFFFFRQLFCLEPLLPALAKVLLFVRLNFWIGVFGGDPNSQVTTGNAGMRADPEPFGIFLFLFT